MTHAELKDIMDNESINELMAGETVYLHRIMFLFQKHSGISSTIDLIN